MPGLISVIVTTYNRPDALDAVLASLERQSDGRFEVIVADDGSGPETAALVARRAAAPMPIRHVWHEDAGFRAAEIRNRAALAAAGDYLVFIDGDCLVRPHFVARHRALAEPGFGVAGERILLSPGLTARLLAGETNPLDWGAGEFLRGLMRGDLNRLRPLAWLPGQAWRRLSPRRIKGVRTCNYAVWTGDFVAVDGFDASFRGWGYEDTDLAVRLQRNGVFRKDGRFATAVLHLWHKEADRAAEPENLARLAAIRAATRIRAEQGLSSLRPIAFTQDGRSPGALAPSDSAGPTSSSTFSPALHPEGSPDVP